MPKPIGWWRCRRGSPLRDRGGGDAEEHDGALSPAADLRVGPGTTLSFFHAAAGGVGQIAGQWAKHLSATVIGTAGGWRRSRWRRRAATTTSSTIRRTISSRRWKITGGKGVDVV